MFLVVWSDEAFEKMANLIRFNPDRKKEFATALREISQQLSERATHRRVGGRRDARNVRG
jgi:hypothetical protein